MTAPTREIRHQVPADVVNVLDGEALAEGIDRGELITRILRQHVEQTVHKATVVLRFAGGNGDRSGGSRSQSERNGGSE